MIEDIHFRRAMNSGLLGGLCGAGAIVFLRLCLQLNVGILDIFPGVVAGTLGASVPFVFLPRGFSLPKDITTLTFQGIGIFCLWVVADGVVKGEIHGFPKGGFLRGFTTLIAWKDYAPIFLLCVVYWSVLAIFGDRWPGFLFSKGDPEYVTGHPIASRNACPHGL